MQSQQGKSRFCVWQHILAQQGQSSTS
uniref:Uncharacterized protein n=1 Tax=Rhizophora mucronata TaxID=61149 RepID=A0A2P2J8K3_RHIMU